MQKYYTEKKLTDSSFDDKDMTALLLSCVLIISGYFAFLEIEHQNNFKKIYDPYYAEKFYKMPSKERRFADKEYSVAVSKILVNDSLRDLKYKIKDLNSSLDDFKSDLLKQQAMNDMILMLKQVKSGNLDNFDIGKMQQAVLEAGYGDIDSRLLKKALEDYKQKSEQKLALERKIMKERDKAMDKMQHDSKEAGVLATDIAREVAENEIEGFIENLSIIARIGKFVIDKAQE